MGRQCDAAGALLDSGSCEQLQLIAASVTFDMQVPEYGGWDQVTASALLSFLHAYCIAVFNVFRNNGQTTLYTLFYNQQRRSPSASALPEETDAFSPVPRNKKKRDT